MAAQMSSTTPNGQAPDKKPYVLDSAHPSAKAAMKRLCLLSSEYMAIMNVRARTPKRVTIM